MTAGETLPQVADLFHVSAADLLAANDLPENSALEEGDELVIPIAGSTGSHPLQYTTHRGDTLVTVADRFNVSTEELRQWNHFSSSSLPAGRRIYVAEPVRLAPAGRGRRRAARASGRSSSSSATRRGKSATSSRAGHAKTASSSGAASRSTKKKRR